MARYKLIVTCKNKYAFQWGEGYEKRSYPCSFLVESDYKNNIITKDFLKQTGIEHRSGIACPYSIQNANGWEVKEMK